MFKSIATMTLLAILAVSTQAEMPRDINGWAHLASNQYYTATYSNATQVWMLFNAAQEMPEMRSSSFALIGCYAYVSHGGEAFVIIQYMPDNKILKVVFKGHPNEYYYIIPTTKTYYQ
jgi:hypothetical protein